MEYKNLFGQILTLAPLLSLNLRFSLNILDTNKIKLWFFFSPSLGDGENTTAVITGTAVAGGVLILGLIAIVIWKKKAMKRSGKIEKKGKMDEIIPLFFSFFILAFKIFHCSFRSSRKKSRFSIE